MRPVPQPQKLNPDAPVRKNRFELTNTKADVIFAFFGYNESFAGEAGLPKFKQDLDGWLKHTLAQKYNGKSAPRLVLFSPIAHENLNDPNLPDGQANNARLKLYTAAMAEVAKANGVPLRRSVHADARHCSPTANTAADDQRHPPERARRRAGRRDHRRGALSRRAEAQARCRGPGALAAGDQRQELLLVPPLPHDRRLFDLRRPGLSEIHRRASRTTKSSSASWKCSTCMTANRDKAVWAVAHGGEYKPVDDNLPPFIPVVTNKPGPLPRRQARLSRRRGSDRQDDGRTRE